MNDYACTEQQFLKNISQHAMTVLRDDGVHRHIRFKRPDSSSYWFDLVTWNGSLCIDGDMGTYVFRRLDDMFEFFRTDRDWMRADATLAINPSYWGEKLQATANFGQFMQFSEERFRRCVKEQFDSWCESEGPEDRVDEPDDIAEFTALKNELWDEIEDEVLAHASDGETRAIDAAVSFESNVAPDFNFDSAWEWRCQDFTYHFIWCCYAIAWGVKTYDDAKATTKEVA